MNHHVRMQVNFFGWGDGPPYALYKELWLPDNYHKGMLFIDRDVSKEFGRTLFKITDIIAELPSENVSPNMSMYAICSHRFFPKWKETDGFKPEGPPHEAKPATIVRLEKAGWRTMQDCAWARYVDGFMFQASRYDQ